MAIGNLIVNISGVLVVSVAKKGFIESRKSSNALSLLHSLHKKCLAANNYEERKVERYPDCSSPKNDV